MTTDLPNTRIINIALVGHVANGKTTLVNALTGVNTKRSANEQKSGRTIKLGYANCVFWTCSKCAQIYTAGQAERQPDCCLIGMDKRAVVSFVDAPGHHSYVHTMVKGATIVDGALLVTDIRKEAMQLQTTEHLAILSVLEVENVIVVQNKADLVGQEQSLKHYTELRKELVGTVAENSAIIPVSAQNNINIDVLRNVLLNMVTGIYESYKHTSNSKHCGFQIIRSFDINKPGTDISKLKGGVLGGTVTGDTMYSVGDAVYIKPGLIQKDGTYQILQTKIESIFSESLACSETTIGGLYGIGTLLDPCLTHNDSLSGNLMGFINELPDVVHEIDMRITKISLDNVPCKIKPKKTYKLIVGNVVIDAVAHDSTSSKHLIMKLARPICTLETKCLIYSADKLVAFGSFGNTPKIKKVSIESPDYDSLIKELKTCENAVTKIPLIKLGKENRNIMWDNIKDISKVLNRTPEELSKHLASETLLNVAMCSKGLRIYKTNINVAKVESILKKYIKEYVICKQCRSLNTTIQGCLACGATVRDLRI